MHGVREGHEPSVLPLSYAIIHKRMCPLHNIVREIMIRLHYE